MLISPITDDSAGLEVWIPKKTAYIHGYTTTMSQKWALRLLPTGIEWIAVLARITDPDYQEKLVLYYIMKQNICESPGDHLDGLLVFLC